MRIGIIGGSFNPPHNDHKRMGLEVLKNNLVDKVIYVPTGDKYTKPGLIEGNHRYNMVKLMCMNTEGLEFSDYEIKRGASYTYETLEYFQKEYFEDEIYFISGTDLILDIENWKNPNDILTKYKLIGLKRDEYENYELPKIYDKYPNSLKRYDLNLENLSSTMIREEIKNNNQNNLEQYLDKEVLNYIKLYGLYK
jgi:nicotinate (nicotinamide) nucleotide adenylyltransferase